MSFVTNFDRNAGFPVFKLSLILCPNAFLNQFDLAVIWLYVLFGLVDSMCYLGKYYLYPLIKLFILLVQVCAIMPSISIASADG